MDAKQKGSFFMKNNRVYLKVTIKIFIILLAACESSAKEAAGKLSPASSSTEQAFDDIHTQEDSSQQTPTLENDKAAYLKKLNDMEEADKHSEVAMTTIEMEEQEAKRYEKWDGELNNIYSILQEQLSAEQMAELRVEQRRWIKSRDEAAKESWLKYEGGSAEALEYIATKASLTRDRCYELVAKYME